MFDHLELEIQELASKLDKATDDEADKIKEQIPGQKLPKTAL